MSKISYELAKELKDAGYYQPWPVKSHFNYYAGTFLTDKPEASLETGDFQRYAVYAPTLSELMEETKADGLNREGNECVAFYSGYMGAKTKYGRGKTQEEAVAKLWLALKKDDK